MTIRFNPVLGLIIVPVEIKGPSGVAIARLVVDTGASRSVVSRQVLETVGSMPTSAASTSEVMTGSGIEHLPIVNVPRLSALGATREHHEVICHTLPNVSVVDGVLGLSFLRGLRLVIDFKQGTV